VGCCGLCFGCHLHDTIYDLEGPNWSVGCSDDPDICARFLELLGGEIILSTKP